jgi:hypothetical protein
MDQQDALNNAPDSPNWGNLEHYHEVGFDNLQEGKYYYYKFNYHQHYIVLITHKFNDRLKYDAVYWRLKSLLNPDLEYDNQWEPVGYRHSFNISLDDMNDQAPAGPRKFYVYDEDVVMEGGMRRGGLVGKKVYGVYKDGSDIYKDRTGYYIVKWNPRTLRPYKKRVDGTWKPSTTRKVNKKRGKKTRRNH